MIEKGITSIPPDPSSIHANCPLLLSQLKQGQETGRNTCTYLFPMEYLSKVPKEIKNHILSMINSAFIQISLS